MKKKEHDVLLTFMQETIEKVNLCLSSIYTVQKLIIEKGLITKEELIQRIEDDKKKPISDLGKKILNEMAKEKLWVLVKN